MIGCPNISGHFPLAGSWTGEEIRYYLGFRSIWLSRNTFCGIGLHFLFAFIFLWGRDKITNLSFFDFCRVVLFEAVCASANTLSPFLMNKDRNHTYFGKYGWSWKWMAGLFLSRSRSSFSLDACSALPSALAAPRKIQSFCTFSSLSPRFSKPFSCVSLVQRYVWRIYIVLIAFLLVWFESLVSWNGPRARNQVVLSLVSWLPLGDIKAPKHQISVSVDKVKNLSFC